MVVGTVAVETPAVGVADNDAARPVEPDANDRRGGQAVAVQDRAGKSPVVRLHPADAGEQRPRDSAGRVGRRGRPPVGIQCRGRNPSGGQGRHNRGIGRSDGWADSLVRERLVRERPVRERDGRSRRAPERRGRIARRAHARRPGWIGRDGSKRSAGGCDSFARRWPDGDGSAGYRCRHRHRDQCSGDKAMMTPSARRQDGGMRRTTSRARQP